MSKREKLTNEQIIDELEKSMGYLYPAHKNLGVARQTLSTWIKEDEELTTAHNDITESHLDKSESKLMEARDKGESWAICFHLKCKGKHRGYTERQELTGADGEKLETGVVILPEADK
jgi:hypothetical protein